MAILGNTAAWSPPNSWTTIAAQNSTITPAQYQAAIAQINAQHAAQANQATISMDEWLSQPVEPLTEDTLTQTIQSISSLGNGLRRGAKKMPVSEATTHKPFQELYSYPALKVEKTKCKSFENNNTIPVAEQYPWCTTYGILGIEVEVENITGSVPLECYWSAKSDGSLRNHGMEFVSIPLQVKQIQVALRHLYTALNHNNTPDFSNRTSIHIHLNCRDLTQDQLWVLCILYCLFEKHYYAFAGTKRLNSIFCVPVYRSNILGQLNTNIYALQSHWSKYCGLNIMPMLQNNVTGTYGTVEFRHLLGTADQGQILRWIDNILALRKAAMEISKPDMIEMLKDMNTSSSYKHLYARLFKESDRVLSTRKDFEECISHTKREIFGDEYAKTFRSGEGTQYWNLARDLGLRG